MSIELTPIEELSPTSAASAEDIRADIDAIRAEIHTRVMDAVDAQLNGQRRYIEDTLTRHERKITDMATPKHVCMSVKIDSLPKVDLSEEAHPMLGDVITWLQGLKIAKRSEGVWLAGPKGTGKSTIARQAAKSLTVPYYSLACNGETTQGAVFGRILPTGQYQMSNFVKAWQLGGLFALEESSSLPNDIANALNDALSSGFLTLPTGERLAMHSKFYVMATDNTFGRGATTEYTGRSRQDGAFLDRFVMLFVDYSDHVDAANCPHKGLRTYLQTIRANLLAQKSQETIGARRMAYVYLAFSLGMGEDQAYKILCQDWNTQALLHSKLCKQDLKDAFSA